MRNSTLVEPPIVPVAAPPPVAEPIINPLAAPALKAREILGTALRQCIAAGVAETDVNRLALEGGFELVRGEIERQQFTRATLETAAAQATAAVTLLANTSRANAEALQALRGEAGALTKQLAAL
jgi:predicted NAD/FAD-binding protein